MNPETPCRRCFLDGAIKAGLAVCAGGMAVPAALYLWPAQTRGPSESLVSAGPIQGFEPGTARMIEGQGRPILVLSLPEGFRAFSAICTHLGCLVKWDPGAGRILCPCHAGVFGPDGKVLSGPPPRPLLQHEVLRLGDELKVKL